MRFVRLDIHAPIEIVRASLSDGDRLFDHEKAASEKGRPRMQLFESKRGLMKIRCEYVGGASKDNSFGEGTHFLGRLYQKEETTSIRGIILTAPIYHTVIAILFVYFIYQCFSLGGFSPVPPILLAFSFYMHRAEFKKQKLIKKYIFLSFKNAYDTINKGRSKKIEKNY